MYIVLISFPFIPPFSISLNETPSLAHFAFIRFMALTFCMKKYENIKIKKNPKEYGRKNRHHERGGIYRKTKSWKSSLENRRIDRKKKKTIIEEKERRSGKDLSQLQKEKKICIKWNLTPVLNQVPTW